MQFEFNQNSITNRNFHSSPKDRYSSVTPTWLKLSWQKFFRDWSLNKYNFLKWIKWKGIQPRHDQHHYTMITSERFKYSDVIISSLIKSDTETHTHTHTSLSTCPGCCCSSQHLLMTWLWQSSHLTKGLILARAHTHTHTAVSVRRLLRVVSMVT